MKKYSSIVFVVAILFLFYLLNAPTNFPVGGTVSVLSGETLHNVSLKLKNNNMIRSRIVFEAWAIIFGGENSIRYADYLFEEKLPVYEIARRIVRGEHHSARISITIPEGFTVEDIAGRVATSKLTNFNKENFIALAKPYEGYLFPDTYYFLSTDTEQEVLNSLRANFAKKVSPLSPLIQSIGKKESEIVIMASLIEGESKGDADREYISGILWKRISIGMPLQVDVAKETYKNKGLTKTPINNPGLKAIEAAINPRRSPYLYYIHGKDGKIHYAKTFTEHRANINKYLK